jgi:hypothetical protein
MIRRPSVAMSDFMTEDIIIVLTFAALREDIIRRYYDETDSALANPLRKNFLLTKGTGVYIHRTEFLYVSEWHSVYRHHTFIGFIELWRRRVSEYPTPILVTIDGSIYTVHTFMYFSHIPVAVSRSIGRAYSLSASVRCPRCQEQRSDTG